MRVIEIRVAKLKVFTFPDTVLKQKAAPISRVEKSYRRLADDMLETMYAYPGVGLAANQVGVLERILVLDTDYKLEDIPDGELPPDASEVVTGKIISAQKPKILINPKIIFKEGSILYCEGCLSVPDFQHDVKRSGRIKVEYQDIDGLAKELSAEGLMAVCIQHEIDHLDGKLFIDRLSPLKKEMVKKKLIEARKQAEEDSGQD